MTLSDAQKLITAAQLAVEQAQSELRSGNLVQALRLIDDSRRLRERSAKWRALEGAKP